MEEEYRRMLLQEEKRKKIELQNDHSIDLESIDAPVKEDFRDLK